MLKSKVLSKSEKADMSRGKAVVERRRVRMEKAS